MTENSKIRPFWDVLESQISKFSSTMVNGMTMTENREVVQQQQTWAILGRFRKSNYKIFSNDGEGMTGIKIRRIRPSPQADVYFHLFFRAITTFFGQKIVQPPPYFLGPCAYAFAPSVPNNLFFAPYESLSWHGLNWNSIIWLGTRFDLPSIYSPINSSREKIGIINVGG